jgi:integrase/recombinase XerC
MPIDKFIDYLKLERGYSKHTLIAYHDDLVAFKDFLSLEYDSSDLLIISYGEIRTWIVYLVNNNISNRSINRKISTLKSFYKFLEKIGDISNNPLIKHQSLKTQKKAITPFSQKELESVAKLFENSDTFEQLRDQLLIELLYTTGIRRTELISLRISDINFDSKTIKVLGKRNKERYIPLLDFTITLIHTYLNLRSQLNSKEKQLLLTTKGKPTYDSLIYKIVNKYFNQISTKDKKSPHILRHAFATHLLDEGAELNVVKELLGHSSLASTQIYTNSNLSRIKEVYKKAHPRSKD